MFLRIVMPIEHCPTHPDEMLLTDGSARRVCPACDLTVVEPGGVRTPLREWERRHMREIIADFPFGQLPREPTG